MIEKSVRYEVGGVSYEGRLVYDGNLKRARPALFVQPNWYGITADNIAQAGTLAGPDFVVLLADMFGTGYGDKSLSMEERYAGAERMHQDAAGTVKLSQAAFDALSDAARTAGVLDAGSEVYSAGFCLGAGILLDQMRWGLPVDASALFHITYPQAATPKPDSRLRARCLILHGADDPITTKAQIDQLEDELMAARVDWQTVAFANEVHSFTDPNCPPVAVARYNEPACEASFALMRNFFLHWQRARVARPREVTR